MPMIKNLVFDFGKVLVNHDLHAVLERYFKGDKETEECFCTILASPAFTQACDLGLVPFGELIRKAQFEHPQFAGAFRFFYENYLDEVTGRNRRNAGSVGLLQIERFQTLRTEQLE